MWLRRHARCGDAGILLDDPFITAPSLSRLHKVNVNGGGLEGLVRLCEHVPQK